MALPVTAPLPESLLRSSCSDPMAQGSARWQDTEEPGPPLAPGARGRSPAVAAEGSMSASERPLVSIIVPSYKMGRFLQETLHSILQQEYRPLEVIVVDGGSPDETVQILERTA